MAENMVYASSKGICRVCLATNVKMYSMLCNDIKTYYEEITGVNISEKDQLPQAFCWECSYRLLKCYRFRNQAILAHSLLESLLESEGSVTEKNLGTINRRKTGLESRLSQCVNTHNYIEIKINKGEISENEEKQNELFDHLDIKKENSDDLQIDKEFSNDLHIENEFIDDPQIEEFSDDYQEIKDNDDNEDDKNDSHSDNEDTDEFDKEKVKNIGAKVTKSKPKAKLILNESLFSVKNLTFDEQVREIEKRKLTDNYTKSDFKCDKCYKGYLYESAFKFHLARHTNKSGKYECLVCKLHFKSNSAMKHHATSHIQKFECKQCSYVTNRLYTTKLHEAFHNGTQYTCSQCDEKFSKLTTYMSHLRVKHPSDIVCELCGNSFISQKGLYLHKKLKHRFDDDIAQKEIHRCEQCDLNFVKIEALETHQRAKHNIGVREVGVIARRPKGSDPEVARRNKLLARRYGRLRQTMEPVQCEQCEETLPNPRAYYNHFRRAHPDKNRTSYPSLKRNHPSMCEVCGRIFKCRSLLEDHSHTHAGGAQFKCDQCDKAFLTRHSLTVHSRGHSANRTQFSCRVCGKNLSSRSNLQRHEFSHTGLKPYKCDLCGKNFKYAGERRSHFQYVHLKKPYPKRTRPRRPPKQDLSKTLTSDSNERWVEDGTKED